MKVRHNAKNHSVYCVTDGWPKVVALQAQLREARNDAKRHKEVKKVMDNLLKNWEKGSPGGFRVLENEAIRCIHP